MRKVLNVGGNVKGGPFPAQYAGWEHVLLDIDPAVRPDIVCDARELARLPGAEYDSVYCSHNLEHYHRHEALKVLAGFIHVLKPDGFAHILVPDLGQVMQAVVSNNLDIEDVLYESPAGPITARDIFYGFAKEIERSGKDYFAHKTGFTEKSLTAMLRLAGFQYIFTGKGDLEVMALAFVNPPSDYAAKLFGLGNQ